MIDNKTLASIMKLLEGWNSLNHISELFSIESDGKSIVVKSGQVSVTISNASQANEKPAEQKKSDPEPSVDQYANKRWRNEKGQIHRDGDMPAVVYADGTKEWYKEGKCHRDGGLPAVISARGQKEWYNKWYNNGKCYLIVKENGKAKIYKENLPS